MSRYDRIRSDIINRMERRLDRAIARGDTAEVDRIHESLVRLTGNGARGN